MLGRGHSPAARETSLDCADGGIERHQSQDHGSIPHRGTIVRFWSTSYDNKFPRRSTYAHTCHIRPCLVQKRYHMPALSHGTLETWIEGIAGEKGEEPRLIDEAGVGTVVVDDGLEASDTTDWLCGTGPERLAYVVCSGMCKERTRRDRHRCNGEDVDPDTRCAGTSG